MVEGAEVTGMSYKVGRGGMLDGLDEALVGMSAGEEKTFTSQLVGGDLIGEDVEVAVKVSQVQEQELPEYDDEFAQLASEFDTVDELSVDVRERLGRGKRLEQAAAARDAVLEKLLEQVEVPLPETIVADELNARRQNVEQQLGYAGITMEKYLEDESQTVEEFEADLERRVRDAVAAQFILDEVAKKEELGVDQNELSQHLVRRAQQSGQDPQEFANHMFEHNHIPELVQEILRGKALATIVESATVKDASGNVVELKNLRPDGTIGEPEAETTEADAAELPPRRPPRRADPPSYDATRPRHPDRVAGPWHVRARRRVRSTWVREVVPWPGRPTPRRTTSRPWPGSCAVAGCRSACVRWRTSASPTRWTPPPRWRSSRGRPPRGPTPCVRLLRALADAGLVAPEGADRYRLTERGEVLRLDHPSDLRSLALMQTWGPNVTAWSHLSSALATGAGTFDPVNGAPLWETLSRHPAQQAVFNAAMARRAQRQAATIRAGCDLTGIGTVVDVGGGKGAMLAALLGRAATCTVSWRTGRTSSTEASGDLRAGGRGRPVRDPGRGLLRRPAVGR